MTDSQDFQVVVGDLLSSASSDYEVQKVLGCGTYGEVTQCRKLATNETVAVKIIKSKTDIDEAKEEEKILKKMRELNSDKFNIVRWNDSFTFEGCFCLEFEKLDISLYEFQQKSHHNSLELAEIRPIVQQLATALEFLKSAGIVHADLKPENIMMVDHLRQPLRVKVIDFGLACNKECTGGIVQTQWYRAPEVLLGVSFNEAIDVWSLGCIAAEMLKGPALFPGFDEYDMMRHIVCTLGKPPDHLLNAGLYTEDFFRPRCDGLEPTQWKFMSAFEVGNFTCNPCRITRLSDLQKVSGKLSREDASADECDRAFFVDLLTKTLKVDASERITPSQILQHPFVTMSHLVGSLAYSVPNEGHPAGLSVKEQPFLQSTTSGEYSPAKKRKRDGGDDSGWGNRSPDTTPAKKRRSGCLNAALMEADRKTSPQRSPVQKRKRDDAEPCITSHGNSPAKKRRNECLDAAVTETGGQTSQINSLPQKRKRDDADSCTSDGNSPAKKRGRVDLSKELLDSIKKLLHNTEDAWSSSTPVDHLQKRRMADEYDSGSKHETTSPVKRRRRSVNLPYGCAHLNQC